MNQQEIATKMFTEYNQFISQKFPNPLPEWFLEKFPIAIMEMPQSAVPYHSQRIQQILSKTPETLSIFETALVANVLLAVKPNVFGWELEHFLYKRAEIERVRDEANDLTKREEARLNRKKQALTNMGGQKNHNGIF